ncbi:hypothetical protein BCM02_106316 [Paenibacillus methanolicus]|uniref:Uncharacterized protein n=1 Tax=Paenibacillus methanolicus TaxID=582686 RepID=A0A5S5C3N1_9BACL|nr:hypothetical protein BCM02_106316 [Paenibacillus methanolicus]
MHGQQAGTLRVPAYFCVYRVTIVTELVTGSVEE